MESRAENLRKRAFLGAIPDDFLRVSSGSSREEPRLHPISYPGGPAVIQQPYMLGSAYEHIAGKLTVTVNQVFILCVIWLGMCGCSGAAEKIISPL